MSGSNKSIILSTESKIKKGKIALSLYAGYYDFIFLMNTNARDTIYRQW
jgi:hypothetical protein